MTTEKLFPSFLILGLLAAPIVGCGGGEETATPSQPPAEETDPPTATQEPTDPPTDPPPFDKWQAFKTFQIASENNSGLDYDGGGDDNGIYLAFETMQGIVIDNVSETIDGLTNTNGTDECEPNCPFTPATAAIAKGIVEDAVKGALSVETINEALAAQYGAAGSPQAFNLKEEGSSYGLHYWSGSGEASSWTKDTEIGFQPGSLATSGKSEFGKGTFFFPLGESGGGFTVKDALTTFTWKEAGVTDAVTGGGVELVALAGLVEDILIGIDEALADLPQGPGGLPEEIVIDDIVALVYDGLVGVSDITCGDASEPCISVTFEYTAEAAVVAE